MPLPQRFSSPPMPLVRCSCRTPLFPLYVCLVYPAMRQHADQNPIRVAPNMLFTLKWRPPPPPPGMATDTPTHTV